eukprot:501929-Amphidinium_carterae.1
MSSAIRCQLPVHQPYHGDQALATPTSHRLVPGQLKVELPPSSRSNLISAISAGMPELEKSYVKMYHAPSPYTWYHGCKG